MLGALLAFGVTAAAVPARIGCPARNRLECSASGPRLAPSRKHPCVCCADGRLALLGGTLLAWHFGNTGNKIQDIKVPLDLTVGLLRMLIFAATAGFAQLLGIGWKNKVLQLATALSFYSAVDLIVSLVERHAGGSKDLERCSAVAFTARTRFFGVGIYN